MENSKSYLKPIQPLFELKTNNFFKHSFNIQKKYWFYSFFTEKKSTKNSVTFLPDGCTNLIFNCNNFTEIYMIYNTVEYVSFNFKSETEYFAIRFSPGENPFFTGEEIKKNTGKIINYNSNKLIEFCSQIAKENSFENKTINAINFLKSIEIQNETKKLFKQLLNIIIKKNGLIKISQLEKLAGYSSRYINYIFDSYSGISAKQFCNIIKFQLVLEEIKKDNGSSFSKIASDYKFYDQSHFIHEFKSFTGMTPSDYSEAMKIAV